MCCRDRRLPVVLRGIASHAHSLQRFGLESSSLRPTYILCSMCQLWELRGALQQYKLQAQRRATRVHIPGNAGSSAHMWISLNEERANSGWSKPKRDPPLFSWRFSFHSFDNFQATAQAEIKIKDSSNHYLSPSD